MNIAVIGAGLSGIRATECLVANGHHVVIFDKSRGVSGRLATRRGELGAAFDHGAQYFTVNDPTFGLAVQQWCAKGVASPWAENGFAIYDAQGSKLEASPPTRFVGTPNMPAIVKTMWQSLSPELVQLNLEQRVAQIAPIDQGLVLALESGQRCGPFDGVVSAVPAEQAADLLPSNDPWAASIRQQSMLPCWATMASLATDIPVDWPGCFINHSWLTWAARNHTKPGRDASRPCLVIHAAPNWTAQHWEHPADEIARVMLAEFWHATGLAPQTTHQLTAHRWKYAIPESAQRTPSNPFPRPNQLQADGTHSHALTKATQKVQLADVDGQWKWQHPSAKIVACGDWTMSGRVEGAYLSGQLAAECLMRKLAAT